MKKPSPPRLAIGPAGNYEIRWTENGRSRRVSTGTSDLAEAQEALADWIFRRGRAPQTAPTVARLLDAYLEDKGMDGTSREGMAAVRLSRILGSSMIDTITQAEANHYGVIRAGEGVKNATIRRELAVLVAAANHAARQRRISRSLVPCLHLPEPGKPKTSTFSREQLDLLLAITAPAEGERMSRLHRFLWIAAETASRRAAVEGLRWSQVDMDAGVIRFDDERDREERRKRKRRVPVPISDRLRPVMERALQEREGGSEFVLDDERPLYQQWKSLMKRAAKESGDDGFLDKTPHDLRRTWATRAARAGVSLFDIAGVLGDSIEVVTKHYAHHAPDYLRSAVNAI